MYSIVKRGQVFQPQVSGNGKVIAWRDLPERGVSAIGLKREGEETQLIMADDAAVAKPTLNQDGSVILWEQHSGKIYADWDLARLEYGKDKAEIIFDSDGRDIDADISNDGNKVVIGHMSKDVRTRTVKMWTKGEGIKNLNPEEDPSGLPEISGDGERVFYLKLPPTPRVPNEIWLQEADGSEKPVVYGVPEDDGLSDPDSPDNIPMTNHKKSFDTDQDGNVLAWIQKDGVQDAQVWRWDLDKGEKEMVSEAPLAGQVDVSDDGSTLTWVTKERVRVGDEVKELSRLHWKQGDLEKIVAEDIDGQNTYPSLSDDGNTLVWMWKNPKYAYPNEIRKIEFDQTP